MAPHVEHLWTILSKGVAKDPAGGLSIIGLVDALHVPRLPETGFLPFGVFVLSYWRRNREPGTTFQQRIVVQCESDGQRFVLPGEDQVPLNNRHLFCAIRQLDRIPIGGHGQHMVIVQRKDSPASEWVDAPPTAGLWIASDEMIKGLPPVG